MQHYDKDLPVSSAQPVGARALSGALLVYRDADSGVYELTFGEDHVRWACTDGPFAGEAGVARYRAAAIDDETLLVVWSASSGETDMLLAKLNAQGTYVCHVYGGECTIVPATVSRWAPPGSVAPRPSPRRVARPPEISPTPQGDGR